MHKAPIERVSGENTRKRGCGGPCENLGFPCPGPVEWVFAKPNDHEGLRHISLCVYHTAQFEIDHPEEAAARLKLSITEWQQYCMDTYGRRHTCKAACCRIEGEEQHA